MSSSRLVADLETDASAVFDRLYSQLAPRLFRRVGARYPTLDAEEILHDTFVRVFRDDAALLKRFCSRNETGDVERFIWDQACGVAANQRRRFWRRQEVGVDSMERPAGFDLERAAIDRDTLGQLDSCLKNRNSRAHLYFVLRYRDGWKPREIAEMAGWTQKLVYRLKRQLDAAVRACAHELEILLT